MNDWNYSNDALNVLSAFYEANKMLYVEGDDDVVFWELILEKFEVNGLKVQSVDGVNELKKYIEKINNNEIDDIAARDLDFSVLDENWEDVPNVIVTYAHSIENTLLCSKTVHKVIRSYGRFKSSDVNEVDCATWLSVFYETFENLVLYDAANELKNEGISILGNNCSKFMINEKSHNIGKTKIDSFIAQNKLDEMFLDFIDELKLLIIHAGREASDFMRGHFLFSGILKFINYKIKSLSSSKSISNDALFSNAILAFENVFNSSHPHYQHYENQMKKIII